MGPLPHGGGTLLEALGGSNTPPAFPRVFAASRGQGPPPAPAGRNSVPDPALGRVLHLAVLAMERLVVRGATQHNLKSVSCDLPRNQLVVITGPSGSGKSSLAFDTIYAEGQRRYVESLSAYPRQFLDQL